MEKSRPDWNVPHFYTAIFYMEKLIEKEGGNPKILLPAIELHDIGYGCGEFLSKKYTFEDNQKVRKKHMIIGAKKSKEILENLDYFTNKEINKISYLISIHDNLKEINSHEAQLVFEADSLAQIDVEKVKPNFDKENLLIFLEDFKEKRVPLFKTKTGKNYLKILLPKIKSYYD
ncbi:HD domain-containing protein [Nanoarchaeota archaeon]